MISKLDRLGRFKVGDIPGNSVRYPSGMRVRMGVEVERELGMNGVVPSLNMINMVLYVIYCLQVGWGITLEATILHSLNTYEILPRLINESVPKFDIETTV